MRIKDKWTDYFKKPKEKMTVRNQHDVAAFLEDLLTPEFTGKPCEDSCFDCRKVRHHEFAPGFRD